MDAAASTSLSSSHLNALFYSFTENWSCHVGCSNGNTRVPVVLCRSEAMTWATVMVQWSIVCNIMELGYLGSSVGRKRLVCLLLEKHIKYFFFKKCIRLKWISKDYWHYKYSASHYFPLSIPAVQPWHHQAAIPNLVSVSPARFRKGEHNSVYCQIQDLYQHLRVMWGKKVRAVQHW